MDFAIVGKLAQTLFPCGAEAIPFEIQEFQFLNSEGGHRRWLSFLVQLVIGPLVCDPIIQLGVFAVAVRDIAMPVDFAIVGKLT